MKILINPPREQWDEVLKRPTVAGNATEEKVAQMLSSLRLSGWAEVCRLTGELDGYSPEPAMIEEDMIKAAGEQLPEWLKQSIALAANNIRKFHESQARGNNEVNISPGITCYQKWMPVERVGLYVPGGTAPLFSTVLMLAIPAQIAGCKELILCSPGNRQGVVNPAILYAAAYCGITKVYRIGGVQAIASMAYGLGPVPKVDKIFGPGNSWVTTAKQLVNRTGVAIDMPAGPSELLVVADDSANPAFVAADLLSQAEHGVDSHVILLTTSWELAERVHGETEIQLTKLPRKDIASKVLDHSKIIVLSDDTAIMQMVNRYAPEHLILATENHALLAEQVKHAGSVFLGHFSPESAGDYATGTNHTLPTSGFAKTYSGLTVDSFTKSITFQQLTSEGLRSIQSAISLMSRAEGLVGHARAAEIRNTIVHSSEGEEDKGLLHSFLDYINPLNLLNPRNLLLPLDILDPESDLNPLNLLNRLVTHEPPVNLSKPSPVELIRKNIAALVPYSSARDEFTSREGIFLDANENPNETGLNRYPDPRQTKLRSQISWLKGIEPEKIFLGNGSDEAIDLLIRIFCEPRLSRIITMNPTYGMYAVCAGIQDVLVDKVLLNPDFSLDTKAILGAIRFDTKMIFLCSPNNPTGLQIPVSEIQFLASRFNGILVVDEAYIDFAEGTSALSLINEFPNLTVLQTFSKAWGLAGVRLGMAFADAEIINAMNKIKYPYNINVLSAETVEGIVKKVKNVKSEKSEKSEKSVKNEKNEKNVKGEERIRPDVRLILTERIKLADQLKGITGVEKVFPSDANFLLVKFNEPNAVYRYLADNGVIVRDRSNLSLCAGCLRITVGTPEENEKLISVLQNR